MHGPRLPDDAGVGVDGEVLPEGGRRTGGEGVPYPGAERVSVLGADFFGEDPEGAGGHSARDLGGVGLLREPGVEVVAVEDVHRQRSGGREALIGVECPEKGSYLSVCFLVKVIQNVFGSFPYCTCPWPR